MNTSEVKKYVAKHGVVTIRADKTRKNPAVEKLLEELGNTGHAIPFYAIYPSDGREPITFDGLITKGQVLAALDEARTAADTKIVTQTAGP